MVYQVIENDSNDRYGVTAEPTPESIAKAIAKALSTRYSKEKLSCYTLSKFGKVNIRKLLRVFEKVM